MLSSVCLLILILFICLVILGIVVEMKYYEHLKMNHNDLWIKLGEPEYFYNLSIKTKEKIKEFEKQKEYLTLNDQKLILIINLKGRVKEFCFIAAVVYIGMWIICFQK